MGQELVRDTNPPTPFVRLRLSRLAIFTAVWGVVLLMGADRPQWPVATASAVRRGDRRLDGLGLYRHVHRRDNAGYPLGGAPDLARCERRSIRCGCLNVLAHSNWSTGFRPRSRRAAIAIAGWSLQRTIPLHWQLGVMAEVIGCLSEDDVSHESRALD